jgi:hypothetical protein
LFGHNPLPKEYAPYKVEYRENKIRHLMNRTIADYLWEDNGPEKGFFELDNGYLISDRYIAPHGTGYAGLHYYESIEHLKGRNLNRFSLLRP